MEAGSVWISRLACSHFRSYAQIDVSLPEGPLAFVGSNGAGKTNLLEAISLFAPGRGLRGAPAAEVASRNAEGNLLVDAHTISVVSPRDGGTDANNRQLNEENRTASLMSGAGVNPLDWPPKPAAHFLLQPSAKGHQRASNNTQRTTIRSSSRSSSNT